MIDRVKIIEEARGHIGDRCSFRGRRSRGKTDCVGLINSVCGALGLAHEELPYGSYGKDRREHVQRALKHFVHVQHQDVQPGDLLMFAFGPYTTHLGIVSERRQSGSLYFVHADDVVGKVVEVRLDGRWLERLYRCFEFREAE